MSKPPLHTLLISNKKSEELFKLSELRYRRLFETAQDGILILEADSGKIVDVNPFLRKMLGYPKGELIGKQLWQIGVFKDIASSKAAFRRLQLKDYIRYENLPLEAKGGRSINVEFVSNTYLVGDNKVIQCNIRDITDRKKAEKIVEDRTIELEKLANSQEETKRALLNVMEDLELAQAEIELERAKDEAMLASLGEGIIAVDNDRRVIKINKATENILGWEAEELMGKEITSLPIEDEQGVIIPFDKRPTNLGLSEGKFKEYTFVFVRKDKSKFPISITVSPIRLNNRIIGLIEIIKDITREQEIDKAKSEFVSLASHQLRTPLGIVKWYLEILEDDEYYKNAPEKFKNYIKEICKSNERVLRLVTDLLSVSRIEQGRVKNVPKPSDLCHEITNYVEEMQVVAHKKNIDLHLNIQDVNIPSMNIDTFRFHEVLENLISNAIEYTPAGGSVKVTVSKANSVFFISVKDTGIGISEKDQKKLFTKFFRSENAVKANPEGTGLGLYLVKSYVEAWGGKVSLESAVGRGSEFVISLPIT